MIKGPRAQVHLRRSWTHQGQQHTWELPVVKPKKPSLNGNITNEGTVKFLGSCLDNFVKYVEVASKLKKPKPIEPEDLDVA